jgi:hypothetical protein
MAGETPGRIANYAYPIITYQTCSSSTLANSAL